MVANFIYFCEFPLCSVSQIIWLGSAIKDDSFGSQLDERYFSSEPDMICGSFTKYCLSLRN